MSTRRLAWLAIALVACSPSEESAREQAQAALARGERDAAIQAIEALRKAAPESPEACLEQAELWIRAGEAPRAVWLLEEGATRFPAAPRPAPLPGQHRAAGRRPGARRSRRRRDSRARERIPGGAAGARAVAGRARRPRRRARGLPRGGVRAAGSRHAADPARRRFARGAPLRRGARCARRGLRGGRGRVAARGAAPRRAGAVAVPGDGGAAPRERSRARTRCGGARERAPRDRGRARAACARSRSALRTRRPRGSSSRRSRSRAACRTWRSRRCAPRRPRIRGAPRCIRCSRAWRSAGATRRRRSVSSACSSSARTPPPRASRCRATWRRASAATRRSRCSTPRWRSTRTTRWCCSRARSCCSRRIGSTRRSRRSRASRRCETNAAMAELLRARLVLARGDAGGARAQLEQLAPRLDTAADTVLAGARARARGRPRGAAHRYRLSAVRDPSAPGPWLELLRLAQARGDWRETRQTAVALIQRAPGLIDGWQGLVDALLEDGERDAALDGRAAFGDSARLALRAAGPAGAGAARAGAKRRGAGRARRGADTGRRPHRDRGGARARAGSRRTLRGRLGRGGARERRPRRRVGAASRAGRGTVPGRTRRGGCRRGGARAGTRSARPASAGHALQLRGGQRPLRGRAPSCGRYVERDPDHGESLFALAMAQQAAGRGDAAVESFRRAAALDPRAVAPRNNLALLLAARGDLDGALAAAQEAYALAEQSPEVLDTLGWLYLEKGLIGARRLAARGRAPARSGARRRAAPPGAGVSHGGPRRRCASAARRARRARRFEPRICRRSSMQHSPARSRWIAAWLALAAAFAACAPPAPRGEIRARLAALGRPNLVLIVVDTLRADRTTPYGFAQDTTPELARWAARGVVFEQVAVAVFVDQDLDGVAAHLALAAQPRRARGARRARRRSAHAGGAAARRRATGATRCRPTAGSTSPSASTRASSATCSRPAAARNWPKPGVWPHVDRVVEEATRLLAAHDRAAPFFLYLHFMDVHEYAAPPEFKRFGTDASRRLSRGRSRWVDDGLRRVRERARGARASPTAR